MYQRSKTAAFDTGISRLAAPAKLVVALWNLARIDFAWSDRVRGKLGFPDGRMSQKDFCSKVSGFPVVENAN